VSRRAAGVITVFYALLGAVLIVLVLATSALSLFRPERRESSRGDLPDVREA
jgi:hypothetical protein